MHFTMFSSHGTQNASTKEYFKVTKSHTNKNPLTRLKPTQDHRLQNLDTLLPLSSRTQGFGALLPLGVCRHAFLTLGSNCFLLFKHTTFTVTTGRENKVTSDLLQKFLSEKAESTQQHNFTCFKSAK